MVGKTSWAGFPTQTSKSRGFYKANQILRENFWTEVDVSPQWQLYKCEREATRLLSL